ncbi:MAG: SIS domain-containing protein [Candidatus Nanopelagicales bacterium]
MRFHDGIQAQPEVLAASRDSITEGLKGVAPLPPGALVSLVGIGASEHAAMSAAATWRELGIRAIAQSASDFLSGALPLADVHVALSESGRSAETIAAMEKVSTRVVSITNGPASPLAKQADDLLLLASGPDSPVYTTGYTATLQALGLLGEHWAAKPQPWEALPAQTRAVIDASEGVIAGLLEAFKSAQLLDVIGTRTSLASAGEGALMLRESARARTASHETQNYLHGPMEALDDNTACIIIGFGREVQLAGDVTAIGCPTLLITEREDVQSQGLLHVVQLPRQASPMARAVLEILPIQVLARQLADARGLAVDGFRYRQNDTKIGEVLALASDSRA